MKRLGNVFDDIVDLKNLKLAFYKAQKRKAYRKDIIKFRNNFDVNISLLREELLSGKYKPSKYRKFIIKRPKERLISAAAFRDRIVHHAIINICEDRFEKNLIDQCCACRKSKGTDHAVNIAKSFRNPWYLKLDIHKYFNSIQHAQLLKVLTRLFKDNRLLSLFELIIKSYSTSEGKGLPIGNLTSQYFANTFLSSLDHYIKETLKCKEYVRYMDDFVLCGASKQQLKDWLEKIKIKLEEIGLCLNNPILNRLSHGFPFLGYRFSYGNVRLSLRIKKNFRERLKQANYNADYGLWDAMEYKSHVSPIMAHLKRANYKEFFLVVN